MRKKEEGLQFALSPAGVDRFSEWLDAALPSAGVRRSNRLRMRLLSEELLLRMLAHFGEENEAYASLEKRFGRLLLRIEIEGQPFNPLNESGDALGDWNSSLITAIDMAPKYTYSWGKNLLRFVLPYKKLNPVVQLAVAFALGLAVGVAGLWLMPQAQRLSFAGAVFEPLYDLWVNILNALSGPVIFFMVITTVINSKQIMRQGGASNYVIGRYFLFSCVAAGAALLCALPFFPSALYAAQDTATLASVLDAVLRFVPENLLSPFVASDTPQLLLIAFLVGGAMIVLGTKVEELKTVLRQLNMIGLLLAKWVSLFVPLFFGVFLALEIWNAHTAPLLRLWAPLLLSVAVGLALLLAAVLLFALRMKVPVKTLLQKLLPDFVAVLKSGGVDDYYASAQRNTTQLLGVDRNYVQVCLPQGLVLYMPLNDVGILIFTVFLASLYGVPMQPLQFFAGAVFAVVLFIATPPVPGANLLAFAVFFKWIGIPGEALFAAMFFDIVFGLFACAGNLTLLELETVLEAKRFGLLQYEKLRTPVQKR